MPRIGRGRFQVDNGWNEIVRLDGGNGLSGRYGTWIEKDWSGDPRPAKLDSFSPIHHGKCIGARAKDRPRHRLQSKTVRIALEGSENCSSVSDQIANVPRE